MAYFSSDRLKWHTVIFYSPLKSRLNSDYIMVWSLAIAEFVRNAGTALAMIGLAGILAKRNNDHSS